MLEHRMPLYQLERKKDNVTCDSPSPPVVPVTDQRFLLFQARDIHAFDEIILNQFGLRVPSPRTASTLGGHALLWMTPNEWLLVASEQNTPALLAALSMRLSSTLAIVTDMSDAFACFDVRSECALDTLKTGGNLDIHPETFGPGSVARTAIADVAAILWRPTSSPSMRCFVDRSFAEHLWNWLMDSAAPGVAVNPSA
jgi:sarcosine oxidase subunit gamma